MKHRNRWFLAWALILTLGLTACGSAASDTTGTEMTAEAAAYDAGADYAAQEVAPEEAATEEAAAPETATAEGLVSGSTDQNLADKIIYSAYGELETLDFEDSLQKLDALIDRYGAFLESSSITGSDLEAQRMGWYQGRTASYTIRVPKEHYADLTGALDGVGNVTYLSSNAENITAQYSDTQAQLDALSTQEQRLLEIMAQADTVEDMIKLESRLGEIRTQTEQLQAQLTNWDRQVSYSTVSLTIDEVQKLTEEPEQDPTYLQQLKRTFLDSVAFLGRAAKALGKVLAAAIPVLVPLAAVVLVVVLLTRRGKRRREKRMAERQAENHRKTLERDEQKPEE